MITQATTPTTTATARPAERAIRALVHCFGLLERIMQPYFTQFGISGSHWGVLRNLHKAEQEGLSGLRLTDLSERLLIRPPSVTGVVDRLERAGLVTRGGSAIDLRTKQVVLTTAGRELIDRIMESHGEQLDQVMAGLSAEEQLELQRLLDKMTGHLNHLLARRT